MRKKVYYLVTLAVGLGIFWIMGAWEASGTPEFAVREANNCTTACHAYLGSLPQFSSSTKCSLSCLGCHTSPTGGGMRNKNGFVYSKQSLSYTEFKKVEELETSFGKFFRLGGDLKTLRTFFTEEEEPETYYQMESSLYLAAEPISLLSFVYEHDFKNNYGQYYGLMKDMPLNMYFMFGRFLTPYGLKVDDHTAFIREKTGRAIYSADEGFLFGLNPGRPFFNLSYTNGNPGSKGFDSNDGKALTLNGGYAHEYFSLSGSYCHNNLETGDQDMMGVSLTGHVWKMSYLGEMDMIKPEVGTDSRVWFHQVNYFPMKGLNIKFQYDYYQPDIDNGGTKTSRYSGGFQLYPVPFMELACHYRIEKEELEANGIEDKTDKKELVFFLHFFF